MKSHESDKYLKQIISHSVAQVPAQPYVTYSNDDDSLLEPLDVDDYEQNTADVEETKGHRHGDYVCDICTRSFKYVKPYKNHMKIHKKYYKPAPAPAAPKLSYYKRKKLEAAAAAGISLKKTQKLPYKAPQQKTPVVTPDRELEKLHADYDSVCPEPDENEHKSYNSRDSSPDFGALMLSTSQYIGNEVMEEVKKDVPRSRTGRPVKRAIIDDDSSTHNQKTVKKFPNILTKKPGPTAAKKSELPSKKPGPLSKTRGKTSPKEHDSPEEVMIAGFSEVDITKMLKKARSNDIGFGENFN